MLALLVDQPSPDRPRFSDPSYPGAVTLLAIATMGIAGAATAHWLFFAAVVAAVLGALAFVTCVVRGRPR